MIGAGKNFAVMFFGGTEVTLAVATQAGESFQIKSRVSADYSGIFDGNFVDEAELVHVMNDLVNNALENMTLKIEKLYIGVPPVFCDLIVRDAAQHFNRPRRVNQNDIRKLIQGCTYYADDRTVIGKDILFFKLDDGRAVIHAAGTSCAKLEAKIGIISCRNVFVEAVMSALFGTYFSRIEFISQTAAEALYYIENDVRDRTCVLVSCGMFSTTVSVAAGEGLCFMESFHMGTAHVINDLCIVLGVDHVAATALLAGVVLSINAEEGECYEIETNGKREQFSITKVNDIVKARLEEIAEGIKTLLNKAEDRVNSDRIFICGGEVDAIIGARDFLSKEIGVHIDQCLCPLTRQNTSKQVLANALLCLAGRNT